MGNNCICKSGEEEFIFEQRDEKIAVKAVNVIQRNFHRIQSNIALKRKILEVMQNKYSQNIENQIIITEIPLSEFNERLQSQPKISQLLNDLFPINSKEIDQSKNYKLMPLMFQRANNKEEKEYYYGNANIKGELNGIGTLITKNGCVYRGNFNSDSFNGNGVYINPKGDYYIGKWKDGQCEGKGILQYNDGTRYEGEFKNNKKNGKGKEKYFDGSEYEGDYIYNKKNGYGKIIYSNGTYYQGEFKENQFNGKGEYLWNDGRKYIGDFYNNTMHGLGKHTWENGDIYEGYYQNGKKQGKGTYIWTDGKKYYGYWNNNEPNGTGNFEVNERKYDVNYRRGVMEQVKDNNDSNVSFGTPPEIKDPEFNR